MLVKLYRKWRAQDRRYDRPVKALAWLGACLVGACVMLQASSRQDYSSAAAAAASLPRLHSLLVSQHGTLALEYYAPGHRATRLANVKSVSKSIISTLVGIAIERKLIGGVASRSLAGSPSCARTPTRASRRSRSRIC